ncbi:unnamed protein product [Mesocestoides corti]|uniref:Bromo domain-containing protein n=3 Tax=Mesocestoides corti TaxID=53468 RepID=A0A158QVF4_MESCO|nr:unnamed protein product [Mesocestoides corti]
MTDIVMDGLPPDGAEELSAARQILNYIMAPNNANIAFPFMDRIDGQALGLYKYNEIVRFPMWLRKISEKLDQKKYPGIKEFVCDFRLILVNCFRYNGVVSRMGRIAEKLELLFEQKLQLLSPDIRAKTTLQASLGCGNTQQEMSNSGLIRRRSSTRLFGSSTESQTSHPIRALMEELEHTTQQDAITPASFLYEGLPPGSPSIPITNENSHALLVARLTHWQRKQHEEELIAGWNDWWTSCTRGRALQAELRKSPEFLEAYQLLWLVDPFLGLSDALGVATSLYHDGAFGDASTDALPHAFVLPLSTSSSSSRQLSLTELELGLSVAPQASLTLATCVSGLLNTAKEREAVAAAVAALSEQQPQQQQQHQTVEELGLQNGGEDSGETTRLASRRLQSSHVTTVKNFSTPPYDVWERRLAARLAQWYEEMPLEKRLEEPFRLERRSGISQSFFNVCGNYRSPLEKQRFHELSVCQQVHILRALVSTVLLSNGYFGFSENLRYSLDKSGDWSVTRPTEVGTDPFRGLTYFYFPEMLRGEMPRIMQYRYPPHPDASYSSPPVVRESQATSRVRVINLPGPTVRLPHWVDSKTSQSIQAHLVSLIEREVGDLSARAGDREDSKLAKRYLSKAQNLASILESFLSASQAPSKSKSKKRKSQTAGSTDALAFSDDIKVADFAFINKISCGPVPLSVTYARQAGNNSRSSLRPTDSCTSLAESVRTNDLETGETNSGSETPNHAKFYQDESNTSPPIRPIESEAYDCLPQSEDENSRAEKADSDKLGVDGFGQGVDEWQADAPRDTNAASSGCTTPCRNSDVEDEREAATKNTEAVVTSSDDVRKEAEDEFPKCNGFATCEASPKAEAKEEEEGEGDNVDVSRGEQPVKKTDDVAEFIPDASCAFDTVVFDLESFCALLSDTSSRVDKGRRLLQDLVSASQEEDSCLSMRPVVERIAQELGDGVVERIKADPSLADALEDRVEAKPEEPAATAVPIRPTKKRRRAPLMCPRSKKSKKSCAQQEAKTEPEDSTPMRILRLHEDAVETLERLADGLRDLEAVARAAEPERVAAHRLAGLRLRKDIEAWEEAKKPKPKPTPTRKIKAPSSPPPPPPPEPSAVEAPAAVEGSPPPPKLPLPPYQPRTSPPPPRPPVFIRHPHAAVVPRPLAPPHPASPANPSPRRIFRFYDTLFTEDARPVRLEANGAVVFIPPETIPLGHRQMAKQMIERFCATVASSAVRPTPP